MLILNRFAGQSFVLFLEDGREIDINVLDILGKNNRFVRVGIEAPKTIKIVRDELIRQEVVPEVLDLSA